jgi:ribosomal-protein-alanine N-acetyltransferase
VRELGQASPALPDEGGEGASGPPLVVRPMTELDLTAVMAIEKASFGVPWTLATFTGLLRRRNTRLWVAERDGAVVGYAAVWMVADQAELGDIAVAEGWRRRGIGTLLLGAVLREMRASGIRELFLEVRESNVGAQRLYARYGFRPVGRRSGYYSKPREDALVLRRLIGEDGSAEPAG